MSICGVKCISSLNGFQHCVFFFPIHLDTVVAATGTLAVLADPDAFLYRLKKFLICRGGSMEVKIGYNFKKVLGIQVVCFLISKLQLAKLCIW